MHVALDVDLTTCDREPIHIPGSIQPHGVLFVLDPDSMVVLQASANASDVLAGGAPDAVGRLLRDVLAEGAGTMLDLLPQVGPTLQTLGVVRLNARSYSAISHRTADALVLELEEKAGGIDASDAMFPRLRAFTETLQAQQSFDELSRMVVRQVREVTGFDRAMIYRFDPEWNGTVMAEDRNEVLPSYLGLRFPASDIPAQARELYRLNRLRLIPDADYRPVPINPPLDPRSGAPTNLSYSVLRSVSPVHLEYMRNMGTGSSMSVSILRDDRLWGLISCHSRGPHHVPFGARAACDLLAQIFAVRVAAQEQVTEARRRVDLQSIQSRLLAYMAAEENFLDGLVRHPEELMRLADAQGAAILFGDRCERVGLTPSMAELRRITAWLQSSGEEIFATDTLSGLMPGASAFKDTASGLLAISISKLHAGYVLWFRPEVVKTVEWGGDPAKPVEPDGLRLHPRKSFEIWKEVLRERSLPWRRAEVETAGDLRNAIVGIVLRKAEEMADLAEELTRSNRELEAFSYSVSHDLRAPFRHIVGFAELLREAGPAPLDADRLRYLDVITEAAHSAGRLVDGLLTYSQMGRASILPVRVDMNRLVAEVRRLLAPEEVGREIDWIVSDLPPAQGDAVMLRQAWQNLLSNAIKYTRKTARAQIEIGAEVGPDEIAYYVRDNGVGFDMAYLGKLFGVFQRLHRVDEFEGTGIGLANVRRIAERHGGRVWAEGRKGEGATFYFALPRRPPKEV